MEFGFLFNYRNESKSGLFLSLVWFCLPSTLPLSRIVILRHFRRLDSNGRTLGRVEVGDPSLAIRWYELTLSVLHMC